MRTHSNCMKPRGGAIFATICAAALALPLFADPVQIDPADYECTFNVKFVGYKGSSTLTDFPVLIRLSKALNGFDYTKCATGGTDIRFCDPTTGELFPHEIDNWDATGTSFVWVRAKTLDRRTAIKVLYGYKGSGEQPAVNASEVWSNGYVGVWHLGEGSAPMAESSGKSTPFNQGTIAPAYAVDGIVGNSVDFAANDNNSDSGRLAADDDDDLDGFEDFTVEYWTRQESFRSGQYAAILSKRNWANNQEAWFLYQNSSTAAAQYPILAFTSNSNGRAALTLSMRPEAGRWTHQAYTRVMSSGAKTWYADGVYKVSEIDNNRNPVFAGTAKLNLGGGGGQYSFPGQIDEVRISNVARSADWLKASHDCVREEDFAVLDLENDWSKYAYKFQVSFTGYEGGEELTDFPVLVKISESGISGFRYDDCLRMNIGDINFADENGVMLDHEIDTWDTNGVSYVWVKVPSLTKSTRITAYYGWQYAPVPDPCAVWSSGYVGVWHLNEPNLPMLESSGVSTAITAKYGTVKYGVSGIVSGALDMSSGDWGAYVAAGDDDDLDGFVDYTLEMWTKQESWRVQDRNSALMNKREDYSKEFSYYWYDSRNGGASGEAVGLLSTNGVATLYANGNKVLPEAGVWTHQAFVRDTSADRCYSFVSGTNSWAGGTAFGTEPVWAGTAPLEIGGSHLSYSFPGQIDEVRISSVARSADWIKATHDTVAVRNFATYGEAKRIVKGLMIIIR